MPDEPRHDAEATARAEADAMGLGVLDAVDVGGTWTVVADVEDTPPADPVVPSVAVDDEHTERRRRRVLLWAGLPAVAAVLVIAAVISRALPGPLIGGAPTPPAAAAPGASGQPGTASTPVPTGGANHARGGATHAPGSTVVPAGQPQPTGFTPAPVPSASGGPTPTPIPSPSSSIGPVPAPVTPLPGPSLSPTTMPPPSPA